MLRPNMQYTELETRVLDVALLLHAEHGGGNNSTFTTRVVTSSGSDTYSAIAAALCSLKGKRHGGAKGREEDLALYNNIEKTAPRLIAKDRKIFKGISPNVDFYSGFVYDMLGIPKKLCTPLFAVPRVAGWSTHRIEEPISANKIIRPAYKSLVKEQKYLKRDRRETV